MILVDTSGLLANYDRGDKHHVRVARVLAKPQRRLLSPFVLAELDYLVARVGGQRAENIVLGDVGRGAYQLESFSLMEIEACRAIISRHPDLGLGLTDASVIQLSHRYGCLDILTLDERHFRTVRGSGEKLFRLFPADSPDD